MKEFNLLYEIRSLEKMISRVVFKDYIVDEKYVNVQPLTPTQVNIINYILEHDNKDIYQKDLEDVLNLRRATVSGVLQTMEKNNLIERTTCDNDARAKKIVLNNRTRQLFIQYKEKIKKLENIIVKDISKEDMIIFSKIVEKMKNNINNIN